MNLIIAIQKQSCYIIGFSAKMQLLTGLYLSKNVNFAWLSVVKKSKDIFQECQGVVCNVASQIIAFRKLIPKTFRKKVPFFKTDTARAISKVTIEIFFGMAIFLAFNDDATGQTVLGYFV